MSNKGYFSISMTVSIISLIMLFVGAGTHQDLIVNTSMLGLLIGIAMLLHWSTISYRWVCDNCGESFEITMWQNLISINGGINYKKLYCPKCNQRNWARGIPKK